jgi:hypothetical protein
MALDPAINNWFHAIADNMDAFIIQGYPFLHVYDSAYPALETGDCPKNILDIKGFSPLLDMLNGHVWRLWCDCILTMDTKHNRQFLATYLTMGETAITADTYLGMAIPGRLCPNYTHHFTVANGWPTDTNGKKFLAELQHLPMISSQAQQYDPVEIDLYQTEVSVPPLATREEQTSARHK